MSLSFRNRLLLTFTGLIFLALMISSLAVFQATNVNIKKTALENLEVDRRVFERLLESEQENLTARASVLANDFGFKRAIATNEQNTIISVLENHGSRINADLLLLLSPAGDIRVSTHDIGGSQARLAERFNLSSAVFNTLVLAENQAYQVVFVPIKAPNLIAWAGLGFVIDEQTAESFKAITKADVTLLLRDDTNQQSNLLSTLPAELIGKIPFDTEAVTADALQHQLNQLDWATTEISLLDNKQQLTVVMATSLQQAYLAYRPLQLTMALIALAALIVCVFLVIPIARRITRPVAKLTEAAQHFASGDYRQNIEVEGDKEFNELANTFNQMSEAIFEREERIKYQANHDLLTDLPNSSHMAKIIVHRLEVNLPHHCFALVLIKLNNLSRLTDSYGIDWSNNLIRMIAERLQQTLRRGDVVAKQSNSQFLLFCDELGQEGIEAMASKIIYAMEAPFHCGNFEVHVEISMGFVVAPDHGDVRDDLLRRAHIALAHCKSEKGHFSVYQQGQDENHLRQIHLTYKLQQAIASDAFELFYQPKFSLVADTTTEVEALLRWRDEELGLIFPDEFIPIAEKSGFILKLTHWVINTAIKQLEVWQAQGSELRISVNISAYDLLEDEFAESVISKVRERGINPASLVLEITESAMVADYDKAIRYLKLLKAEGVGLSMDDYGTGFSSLWQLKSIPVHELKIDKSFVLELDSNLDDQKIVKSTIDLGHNLGMTVIAEGVENLASIQVLEAMGCDSVQGYFLSKPIPVAELDLWLQGQPQFRNETKRA